MPLPFRPLFRYGENVSVFLDLPITPWTRSTAAVGGDIEADSGARAAFIVRRDEFLTFSLRFFEDEWPYVQFLIDYAQTGQSIVWYPDQEDLGTSFACYLESPAVGGLYQPTPDASYPRVFQLEITLVKASPWTLPVWPGDPDAPPPSVPTGWVIHYYTAGNSTFTVLAGSAIAEVLIVGAGGSGGSVDGTGVGAGGGGAGGVRHFPAMVLGPGTYPTAVGTGAASNHAEHMIGIGVADGSNGGESSFGDYAAQGGGGGGAGRVTGPHDPSRNGHDGASGGGGASSYDPFNDAADNNFGGSAIYGSQGTDGGPGIDQDDASPLGGGGGGAGGAGSHGVAGPGLPFGTGSPTGTTEVYGVGGSAKRGDANLADGYGGGGGGGGGHFCDGASGNGGIVIVKYPLESGMIAIGGIRVEFPD